MLWGTGGCCHPSRAAGAGTSQLTPVRLTVCTCSDRWGCLVAQQCHTGCSSNPAEQRIFSSAPCKSQPAVGTNRLFFSLLCSGNLSAIALLSSPAERALGYLMVPENGSGNGGCRLLHTSCVWLHLCVSQCPSSCELMGSTRRHRILRNSTGSPALEHSPIVF